MRDHNRAAPFLILVLAVAAIALQYLGIVELPRTILKHEMAASIILPSCLFLPIGLVCGLYGLQGRFIALVFAFAMIGATYASLTSSTPPMPVTIIQILEWTPIFGLSGTFGLLGWPLGAKLRKMTDV
jgi:hypothetical protein